MRNSRLRCSFLSFEYWSVSAREVGFGDVNRGVFLSGSEGSWTVTPPASDMSTSAIVVDAVVDGSSRHRIQSDQRREDRTDYARTESAPVCCGCGESQRKNVWSQLK